MKLSLVLPAHNEAPIIADCVTRVDAHLRGLGHSYEILVGDSGSTDETVKRVEQLGLSTVRIVRWPERGKGSILSACFRETHGQYAGFLDSDLEIDVSYVGPALAALEEGYDAVIASKTLVPECSANRPLKRRLATAAYNATVRALFRTTLSDHQAGLKLFHGDYIRQLVPQLKSTNWLWDTEVLVAMTRSGLKIRELPVETRPRSDTRMRVASSPLGVFFDLVKLYTQDRKGHARRRATRRRGIREATHLS